MTIWKPGLAAGIVAVTLVLSALPVGAETSTASATGSDTAPTTGAFATVTTTPSADAPADDSRKTYTIQTADGTGTISEQPAVRTFWEYPLLSAGQQRQGTLTIVNSTTDDLDLSTSSIDLPYSDAQALTYLSYLTITVGQSGGGVLYQGRYTDIAGVNGTQLKLPVLAAGKSATYTVTLRCAFPYTGTPAEQTAAVVWRLGAQQAEIVEPADNTSAWVLGIGAGILLAAVLILIMLRAARRRQPLP